MSEYSSELLYVEQKPQYSLWYPQYTWKVTIGGDRGLSIFYSDDNVPNFFWRYTQKVILGFVWTKI